MFPGADLVAVPLTNWVVSRHLQPLLLYPVLGIGFDPLEIRIHVLEVSFSGRAQQALFPIGVRGGLIDSRPQLLPRQRDELRRRQEDVLARGGRWLLKVSSW